MNRNSSSKHPIPGAPLPVRLLKKTNLAIMHEPKVKTTRVLKLGIANPASTYENGFIWVWAEEDEQQPRDSICIVTVVNDRGRLTIILATALKRDLASESPEEIKRILIPNPKYRFEVRFFMESFCIEVWVTPKDTKNPPYVWAIYLDTSANPALLKETRAVWNCLSSTIKNISFDDVTYANILHGSPAVPFSSHPGVEKAAQVAAEMAEVAAAEGVADEPPEDGVEDVALGGTSRAKRPQAKVRTRTAGPSKKSKNRKTTKKQGKGKEPDVDADELPDAAPEGLDDDQLGGEGGEASTQLSNADLPTGYYMVEAIVDSRVRKRKLEYLVHWKTYSSAEDTWEYVNVKHMTEEIEEFHSKHPDKPSPQSIKKKR